MRQGKRARLIEKQSNERAGEDNKKLWKLEHVEANANGIHMNQLVRRLCSIERKGKCASDALCVVCV